MLWSSTLRCFRFWSIGACVLHFKSVMIDLIKPHRFLSWVGIPYTPLSCAVALFRTQLSHFIMWNLLRVGKLRFSDKIDCMNFDHHTTKATGMWRSFARKLYRADICTCAISWFRHHSIRLGLAQHCTRSCLSITSSLSSFIVLCLSWGSPFFMRSASISSIGQYSTLIRGWPKVSPDSDFSDFVKPHGGLHPARTRPSMRISRPGSRFGRWTYQCIFHINI